MTEALFIIGAPRCGTTWLFENLVNSQRVIHNGKERSLFYLFQENQFPIFKVLRRNYKYNKFEKLDLVNLLKNFSNTEDYLRYIKQQSQSGLYLDASPIHMLLAQEYLLEVHKQLSKINLDAKFLLLYRDPISRIISAVNYLIENRKKDEIISGKSVNDLFLNYAKSRACFDRTNYLGVYNNYKSIFGDKFSAMEFELNDKYVFQTKINEFCEVKFEFNYKSKINSSKKIYVPDQKTKSLIKDLYSSCEIRN